MPCGRLRFKQAFNRKMFKQMCSIGATLLALTVYPEL